MPGYELIGNEEFDQIKDVFNNGAVLFRHGFDDLRNNCFKVQEFEDKFAKYIGSNHCLAVSSGTAALRVALASLNIGAGDEVITQSFTFVATVEAIIESGASPICTDIDDTLNMDPYDLESKITSKTKAVICVHMLGTPAELKKIKAICNKHNIYLIEDTAWGCGGKLDQKNLGNWGDIGTFSFDFAKTLTTGEGGMISFKKYEIFKKAKAWHDHGHENNPKLPRWEDSRSSSGFNFRMTELQGAVGVAQLSKLDSIVNMQRANALMLIDFLKDTDVTFRRSPKGSFETYDALILLMPSKEIALKSRENLLRVGLNTKILPEAFSWHFAGSWEHMPELLVNFNGNFDNAFEISRKVLSKAVALPISTSSYSKKECLNIKNAISNALNNK